MANFNIKIAEEKFYNNGKIILKSMGTLEANMRKALNSSVSINTVTRSSKGKTMLHGVSAGDLNKVLRQQVATIPNINGETHVKDGIFFQVSKEGFDFTIYDKTYNFSRLYNYYVGYRGILNGDRKIINELSEKERDGLNTTQWQQKIQNIANMLGGYNIDYVIDKQLLTVVGEFQFGNWALAYRDIIRLLNANANPGVDFYIYITATGKLQSLLSANTVNYKQINDIFAQNLELIQIPTWIIGLDV